MRSAESIRSRFARVARVRGSAAAAVVGVALTSPWLLAACTAAPRGDAAALPDAAGPSLSFDAAAPPDLAQPVTPGYPPPPYGTRVCDTLYDVSGLGYRLSSEPTSGAEPRALERLHLGELHARDACRCVLVSLVTGWCPYCKAEQRDLITNAAADPSFCVFEVLAQNRFRDTVEQHDLDIWTQTYHQGFPVVIGDLDLLGALPKVTGWPTNLIVDARTMRLLGTTYGDDKLSDDARAVCAAGAGSGP